MSAASNRTYTPFASLLGENSDGRLHLEEKGEEETIEVVMISAGDEIFAIPLNQVHEIIETPPNEEITRVPKTTDHFLGVFALRGESIGLISLAGSLGLQHGGGSYKNLILIMYHPQKKIKIGMQVDRILEVSSIDRKKITTDVSVKSQLAADFIEGFYQQNDLKRILVLLNLEKILGDGEWSKIDMSARNV